ncbi:TetR/AcrR family transcriptional regulator [Pseudonocardia adelaidensis]|uniref:TetR/AcrR family transcriptional regulator n=1 Tax=Pseudonocardia adelaidensis TaxID=648754 RepID=UPI003CD08A77
MTVPRQAVRTERADATREVILATAERLFAEHGVFAVSNRQVSEAAGQGNNAAVGYHFGTKTDLVRAIVHRHDEHVEQLRTQMLADVGDSRDVREWVACLVRPSTEHIAELGSPTWYARFIAQCMTDPGLRRIIVEETLSSETLRAIRDGLGRCLADLPEDVREERADMSRQLMVHMTAERERALAEGTHTPRASWYEAGTGLIDAIVAIWQAPVSGAAASLSG